MRVLKCEPAVEADFPLSFADIQRGEGVYEPRDFPRSYLIVIGGPTGKGVLYHDGIVGTLEMASSTWSGVMFRRALKRVCFELCDEGK